MNRWIIILFMTMFIAPSVFAQEGLNVARFFSEPFISHSDVTMISFFGNGKDMQGVKIYKSISVENSDVLSDQIANAVIKDGNKAKTKEVSIKGGKLYFGFYSLGGKSKNRRYLLFLDRRVSGGNKTTMIFIEGDMDDNEVKKLMKNR